MDAHINEKPAGAFINYDGAQQEKSPLYSPVRSDNGEIVRTTRAYRLLMNFGGAGGTRREARAGCTLY
jgi:hypothetical protein